MLMKKIICFVLVISVLMLSACGGVDNGSAGEQMKIIINEFSLSERGVLYLRGEEGERELTDELLSRLFADGGNIAAFENVRTCAVFLFRNFYGGEIDIIELCDVSHKPEMLSIMKRRAKKKSEAVVFQKGGMFFSFALKMLRRSQERWGSDGEPKGKRNGKKRGCALATESGERAFRLLLCVFAIFLRYLHPARGAKALAFPSRPRRNKNPRAT